jgi:hypothetical protein
MKECVLLDGVRTANARAHAEKGCVKKATQDKTIGAVCNAIFEKTSLAKR